MAILAGVLVAVPVIWTVELIGLAFLWTHWTVSQRRQGRSVGGVYTSHPSSPSTPTDEVAAHRLQPRAPTGPARVRPMGHDLDTIDGKASDSANHGREGSTHARQHRRTGT
jgi:hypothetical protein